MKKLSLSMLLAATLLGATEYKYEISPVAGYDFSTGQKLDDYAVYGAEIQYNGYKSAIKPELSFLFGQADYTHYNPHQTDVWRTAINGVYELGTSNKITPFVKAGIGYESINDRGNGNRNRNGDGAFANAGVGVKIGLMEQLALKLEAIDLVKWNDFDLDNNFIFLGGLTFSFAEKAKPAPVPAPVVAAPKPTPAPVVEAPKPVPAPIVEAPKPVVAAPVDSDGDGVFDPQDKCPGTPKGFKVDADGCPVKATLHLHFATDSNKVDAEGTAKVKEFASFLKDSPAYKASIVGHTDSTASEKYNQKLSEKRAHTVKEMLVKEGVEASRLTSSGKGESQPIATNKTKKGRAENRRIEVELSH